VKASALLILLTLTLVACSGESVSQIEPSLDLQSEVPISAPAAVFVEGEETVTLKVLSFNVLYGAGHDRRFDINIPERFKGVNRMQVLLNYLEAARPDILAVQEAGGWIEGSRPVAAQIAEQLGMHYVIAKDPWDLHIILFSRFPILEAAAVTRAQDFNGVILIARLAVADNLPLDVVLPHLYSMSSQTRLCQIEALKEMVAPLDSRTLLIGDMNFRPGSNEARSLESAGWQLVAAQEFWRVDQIWFDPGAGYSLGSWWESLPLPAGISDHLPIGTDITFSITRRPLPKGDLQAAPLTPRTMNYACAVPTPINAR
jgi:endonuclease/exonuclease/phosphatase family metal-dependent hydrolase